MDYVLTNSKTINNYILNLNKGIKIINAINPRLSSDVWYSGYSPYFVLKIDAIGRSIPGELYWRSSDPLSKKEYNLNFSSD